MTKTEPSGSSFTVSESLLGSSPTIDIARRDGSMMARIALTGATLIQWSVDLDNELVDLIDGYQTEKELVDQEGVRSGIMTPFTNRVENGSYSFGGIDYDLRTGPPPSVGTPPPVLHGILRE